MEKQTACQSQPNSEPPSDGLTVAEALTVHRGWDAAVKGEPLQMSEGKFWVEGWLNFHWMKGGPNRSWQRH